MHSHFLITNLFSFQVSVKLEYAFPMSAVILALWHEFPDFGHLFLATLYEYCPYMLPHAIPRDSQESEAQHLKKLGFKIGEDGKVEDEDQFIKRMTGIAR